MYSIRRRTVLAVNLGVVCAAVVFALAATAQRDAGNAHQLRSTVFAAQVGSLTDGGSVYAGAAVDRSFHHGALVLTAHGVTRLRVIFREFFATGSLTGRGRIRVRPATDGGATLAGALTVSGGTGRFRGADGSLRLVGTIDPGGEIVATIRGSFTR